MKPINVCYIVQIMFHIFIPPQSAYPNEIKGEMHILFTHATVKMCVILVLHANDM